MKKIFLVLVFFSTLLFSKEVTVSILPQKYFVEKIAKDKVNITVMVKPGASPATYEPKVSQMRQLSKADIYFAIDVPFEKVWLERFKNANSKMLVVNTDQKIAKIEMEAHVHHDEKSEKSEKNTHDSHENHEHGHHDNEKNKHDNHEHHEHEHENHKEDDHHKHEEHGHHDHEKHEETHHDDHHGHVHTGLDPHIWLDPILVKTQAKTIYETLAKVDSENKDFYKTNYENFLKELDALDIKIKTILKDDEGKAFMVFHPSWGYFAKRYNLEQIAIEVQGKEPKPAQLIELVEEAKKHNIKIVFVAPQFSTKGAKTISTTIKGNVVFIDPVAQNWGENLLKVANEISKSYK